MTAADLKVAAGNTRWFHTMDLGQGVRTTGVYDPSRTLPRLALPARLDGMRVLDVGAWDGYYSFEMERRGATVLATDRFAWCGESWARRNRSYSRAGRSGRTSPTSTLTRWI